MYFTRCLSWYILRVKLALGYLSKTSITRWKWHHGGWLVTGRLKNSGHGDILMAHSEKFHPCNLEVDNDDASTMMYHISLVTILIHIEDGEIDICTQYEKEWLISSTHYFVSFHSATLSADRTRGMNPSRCHNAPVSEAGRRTSQLLFLER